MSFADYVRRFAERQRGNTPRPAPALPIIQSPLNPMAGLTPASQVPPPVSPEVLNAFVQSLGLALPFPQLPASPLPVGPPAPAGARGQSRRRPSVASFCWCPLCPD